MSVGRNGCRLRQPFLPECRQTNRQPFRCRSGLHPEQQCRCRSGLHPEQRDARRDFGRCRNRQQKNVSWSEWLPISAAIQTNRQQFLSINKSNSGQPGFQPVPEQAAEKGKRRQGGMLHAACRFAFREAKQKTPFVFHYIKQNIKKDFKMKIFFFWKK